MNLLQVFKEGKPARRAVFQVNANADDISYYSLHLLIKAYFNNEKLHHVINGILETFDLTVEDVRADDWEILNSHDSFWDSWKDWENQ